VLWVIFAWVVAVALAGLLGATAGLGVWRSAKLLTASFGKLGERAAAAADTLASVTDGMTAGPSEPAGRPAGRRGPGHRTVRGPNRWTR
jgi:hypothetical protein